VRCQLTGDGIGLDGLSKKGAARAALESPTYALGLKSRRVFSAGGKLVANRILLGHGQGKLRLLVVRSD